MAIGMLVERHTGYNVFYNWSATILKPIATVAPSPTDIHPVFGSDGRVTVVGPTLHGLAATTMLVVVDALRTRAGVRRHLAQNVVAECTRLWADARGGGLDRQKDRPARARRGRHISGVLQAAPGDAPRACRARRARSAWCISPRPVRWARSSRRPRALAAARPNTASGDFSDVAPDMLAHPVIGRGFGTLDSEQSNDFRINDDEYIDEIWEVGIVGLLAYLFMIMAPVIAARRAIRTRDPDACVTRARRVGRLCRLPGGQRAVRRDVLSPSAIHVLHGRSACHGLIRRTRGKRGTGA